MSGKHNRGMTMVEIVVAFVMLTLVMGIMYSCIQFASNLMKEAADIDRENAVYQKNVADQYRSGYAGGTTQKTELTFYVVKADGTVDESLGYKCEVYTQQAEIPKTVSSGGGTRNIYLYSTGE